MNMKNELITMDPDYIFFFTWGSLDLFLPQEKHYHESIIKKKLKKNIAGNKNSQICFTKFVYGPKSDNLTFLKQTLLICTTFAHCHYR